jgi:hypothetical protein
LDDAAMIVPPLGMRNLPAHFCKQHLQRQLLVDAEQDH